MIVLDLTKPQNVQAQIAQAYNLSGQNVVTSSYIHSFYGMPGGQYYFGTTFGNRTQPQATETIRPCLLKIDESNLSLQDNRSYLMEYYRLFSILPRPNNNLSLTVANTQTQATTFLIEVNAQGDTISTQGYSSDSLEGFMGSLSINTQDGGYCLATLATTNMVIVKIDAAGQVSWSTRINNSIMGTELMQAQDGSIYLAGGDFNGMILAKLDSLGNVTMLKRYTGMDALHYEFSMWEEPGGLICMGGTADQFAPVMGPALLRVNPDGSIHSSFSVRGGNMAPTGFFPHPTGGYLISGQRNYDQQCLLKVDALGNVEWGKAYMRDRGFKVGAVKGDGSIVVYGTTNSFSIGTHDSQEYPFVSILDSLGGLPCQEEPYIFTSYDSISIAVTDLVPNAYPYAIRQVPMAQSFAQNAINIASASCPLTGLPEQEAIQLTGFPNPAQDDLSIRLENGLILAVDLVDMQGRIVLRQRDVNRSEKRLNLNGVVPGVYFARVQTESGFQSIKVIKQ